MRLGGDGGVVQSLAELGERGDVEAMRLLARIALELDVLDDADLLLANIISGILCELAPRFGRQLRPGAQLVLAGILVVIAIYFFLRSFRATLIPAITLPISVVGTFAGMYVCGHSIDNISLLALTLAVGFVVDDAIVMLENIVRHIEAGEKPMDAAFKGSKEVSFTIISMTLSLVAVFIPVLFMGGVVGRMFNEFGLVISMAILISGVVSLTLTPMLCSRLLKPIDHHEKHNVLLRSFEWTFNKITQGYSWALLRTVKLPRLVLAITLGTFVLTAVMFQAIPKGFFPIEDIGQLNGSTVGPDDASFDAMVARQSVVAEIIKRDPDVTSVMSTVGGGNAALTAAIAARQGGAKVGVIESANRELRGGNTRFTGGLFRFTYRDSNDLARVVLDNDDVSTVEFDPYLVEDFQVLYQEQLLLLIQLLGYLIII